MSAPTVPSSEERLWRDRLPIPREEEALFLQRLEQFRGDGVEVWIVLKDFEALVWRIAQRAAVLDCAKRAEEKAAQYDDWATDHRLSGEPWHALNKAEAAYALRAFAAKLREKTK